MNFFVLTSMALAWSIFLFSSFVAAAPAGQPTSRRSALSPDDVPQPMDPGLIATIVMAVIVFFIAVISAFFYCRKRSARSLTIGAPVPIGQGYNEQFALHLDQLPTPSNDSMTALVYPQPAHFTGRLTGALSDPRPPFVIDGRPNPLGSHPSTPSGSKTHLPLDKETQIRAKPSELCDDKSEEDESDEEGGVEAAYAKLNGQPTKKASSSFDDPADAEESVTASYLKVMQTLDAMDATEKPSKSAFDPYDSDEESEGPESQEPCKNKDFM